MKIGIVLPKTPAYSETFFTSKIEGIKSQGHEVVVFVNNSGNKTFNLAKVKIGPQLSGNKAYVFISSLYYLAFTWIFQFRAARRLYLLDKQDGSTFMQRLKNSISNHHILTESLDWLHFGFGTMLFHRENVARAIGAKMAVSFRGFDIGVYPIKHSNCYQNIWKKLDKIHVISDDIKDLVYKNGFNDECPIEKITPAINTIFFNADSKEKKEFKKNKLITIARLHWKKGLIYTLEALAVLKEKGVDFHYKIIGDGSELERLQFTVYQLNLTGNVTFLGAISPNDVKKHLEKSNIYIQYSIQEGFCNAVLEAQALGLLCVVSDAEGLSENVKDRKSGYVVEKCIPEKLAVKLIECINLNKKEKEWIRSNARKRVMHHFSLKKQIEMFKNFYN